MAQASCLFPGCTDPNWRENFAENYIEVVCAEALRRRVQNSESPWLRDSVVGPDLPHLCALCGEESDPNSPVILRAAP